MILNTYTILFLFTAAVTGVLALLLAFFSFRIFYASSRGLAPEERTDLENRSYLLLYIATVILWVKLLSWPLFYFTLHSYVPYIHGAMCIFGVTQARLYSGSTAQIIKPAVFFLAGAWLLLSGFDRRAETSPLFRRIILFLGVLSLVVLADSVHDFMYLTSFDVTSDVSCCTTFFDLPDRATASLSVSLIGHNYEKYLLPLYYLSNIMMIAFLTGARLKFVSAKNQDCSVMLLLISGAMLSLVNAAVTVIALFEVIAPVVMELPYHRCIYCMWQYAPGTVLMTGSFVLGTFSAGWALLIYLLGRHEETSGRLSGWLMNLYLSAIAFLGASLVMAIIYMIIKRGYS